MKNILTYTIFCCCLNGLAAQEIFYDPAATQSSAQRARAKADKKAEAAAEKARIAEEKEAAKARVEAQKRDAMAEVAAEKARIAEENAAKAARAKLQKEAAQAGIAELIWHTPREVDVVGKNPLIATALLRIDLDVKSTRLLDSSHFQVFFDEQLYPITWKKGDFEATSEPVAGKFRQKLGQTIRLDQEGMHRIKVQVVRNQQVIGESELFSFEFRRVVETAHLKLNVLSVGVSQPNLKSAANDARNFASIFSGQSGEKRLYNQTNVQTLTGNDATFAKIVKQFSELKERYERGEITDKDVIILFFSTYGDKQNGLFYLQSSDYSSKDPVNTGVSWQLIQQKLGAIPCKKLLFLEVSKANAGTVSGKAALNDMIDTRNKELAAQTGWTIFMSSKDGFLGNNQGQNSIFMTVLNEALTQGKANLNQDKMITIQELQAYLEKRVSEWSGNRQLPQRIGNELPLNLPVLDVK